MIEIQSAAQSRGHVRAVFSQRWRGFALPLDLVRAHLKTFAVRLSAYQEIRKSASVALAEWKKLETRGRVRAAFADYLVTDDEACYTFRNARVRHQPVNDRLAMTGRGPWSFDLHSGLVDGGMGCMDAPHYIAAGAMRAYRCDMTGDRVKAQALWARP